MRETEKPVKVELIEERVTPDYVTKFNAALPGKPIDLNPIAQAVAAFKRTLAHRSINAPPVARAP